MQLFAWPARALTWRYCTLNKSWCSNRTCFLNYISIHEGTWWMEILIGTPTIFSSFVVVLAVSISLDGTCLLLSNAWLPVFVHTHIYTHQQPHIHAHTHTHIHSEVPGSIHDFSVKGTMCKKTPKIKKLKIKTKTRMTYLNVPVNVCRCFSI